jgi:histidinol-phosphate aminotransferase
MSLQPKRGILDVKPYTPGKAKAAGFAQPLKLSANENPLGCSEKARAAYLAAADEIHLYPDAQTTRLRAAIAEKHGLEPERLVFGAGSDEIFAMACQAYLDSGETMLQPEFGFAAWAIAARAVGGVVKNAPEREYAVDIDALLAAVDGRTRVVFIANPANPTGTAIAFTEIERLHARLPETALLVLDGAYAELACDRDDFADGLEWSRDKHNVLVTRTFSKIYGLASLRIGWGYAPAPVADALSRIRLPFSISRSGEAAALAALEDEAFFERSVKLALGGRAQIASALNALGVRTLQSSANFVTACFADAPLSAPELEAALAKRGILVRGLSGYGMPDWLRFSVGREEEMERLLGAVRELLAQR